MPESIQIKQVLNKTRHRDPWFLDDYTVNPYSGCSFNCLYCYIRGSKYGEHMEERVSIKENAAEVLDRQLHNRAKKHQYGIIVLSSATDPYLQFERDLGLTRELLAIILKHRFPVHMITKSDLITRDFDLLEKIEQAAILPADLQQRLTRKVFITFSFSTLDDQCARIFEPGATPPSLRLETLKAAKDAGFFTGVSLMPLLPYISDTSEQLHLAFQTFSDLKIDYLFPASLTLFGSGSSDSRTLVMRAIAKHYPQLEEKYHRFFDSAQQMPAYYQQAFQLKMKELAASYQLKLGILPFSH